LQNEKHVLSLNYLIIAYCVSEWSVARSRDCHVVCREKRPIRVANKFESRGSVHYSHKVSGRFAFDRKIRENPQELRKSATIVDYPVLGHVIGDDIKCSRVSKIILDFVLSAVITFNDKRLVSICLGLAAAGSYRIFISDYRKVFCQV